MLDFRTNLPIHFYNFKSTDITVLSTDYYYIFLFFMGVQIKTKYFYIMSELFTNQIFFYAYLISQINMFN